MLPLPCMLVCIFVCANRTRDRGCSKHPVFPAPSISKRANEMQASGGLRREKAKVYPGVIASAAKQSMPPRARKDGLLRFARNDALNSRAKTKTTGNDPAVLKSVIADEPTASLYPACPAVARAAGPRRRSGLRPAL